MEDILRAKKLLESKGYVVTKVEDNLDESNEVLGDYNISSPLVFSSYKDFEEFMEEVIGG